MAQPVTAYRASNGSLHATPEEADRVDAGLDARRLAAALVDAIRPAYSDADEILTALLDQEQLVIALAAALVKARL